jgi:hypothetical protein
MDRQLWEKTQRLLRSHAVRGASRATESAPSPLTRKLFDESGKSLTPSHAVKGERRYRYYVSSRVQSVAEIAEREGVADRYVRRVSRLAFLAPEIVETIVAGSQPPELTAEALAERIDLPLLWTAQEQAVGIAQSA